MSLYQIRNAPTSRQHPLTQHRRWMARIIGSMLIIFMGVLAFVTFMLFSHPLLRSAFPFNLFGLIYCLLTPLIGLVGIMNWVNAERMHLVTSPEGVQVHACG